jgi:hypothetical protein
MAADEMKVAGTATSCTNGKLVGDVRIGGRGDSLVVNANPHQAASREFKCRRPLAGRR